MLEVTTLNPQYLFDSNGKESFVVLTIEEYQQLLEDLHDLTVMSKRQNETRTSLDAFEEKLRSDGLI
jgi:hypothetical protein